MTTQIDFKTKMLCNIEKGIIKRQFPFSKVKSCDDGTGSRFTISFKGHHDYELEATSLEDKHKVNLFPWAFKPQQMETHVKYIHSLRLCRVVVVYMPIIYAYKTMNDVILCFPLWPLVTDVISCWCFFLFCADHSAHQSDHLREHIQWPWRGKCRNTPAVSSITEPSGRRLVAPPRRPGILQMGQVRTCLLCLLCKAAKAVSDEKLFVATQHFCNRQICWNFMLLQVQIWFHLRWC